ncbi:MAG: hypothetical protein GXP42_12905 [Chloroflexi bacterium]|nr:hypothetical protein [Chloroflexota bacterium]
MYSHAHRALGAFLVFCGLLLLALAAVAAPVSPHVLNKETSFNAHLPLLLGPTATMRFEQGVASGDVGPDKALLWTRGDREATVRLEVAEDADFQQIVVTRTAPLRMEEDYTAKIAVEGLTPAQTYYYRWRRGQSMSVVGAFRTAPAPNESRDLRFAFSGDSDGTLVNGKPYYNHFETLDAVRAENPDFFVYLGDTIYADSYLRESGAAQSLDEYRDAYKTNRGIAALPALLAAVSTYAIWDDHEVYNDFAGATVDPARFADGRKAFLEYMPIDESVLLDDPTCANRPLFRTFRWGSEAEIIVLDERSCRSAAVAQQCTAPGEAWPDLAPTLPAATRLQLGLPATPPFGCRQAITDPTRTLLGPVQKAMLKKTLLHSKARFKFIINELNIQQIYAYPYDRWEGYAAERAEILNFIRDNEIENVIFLTTDLHANLMNEVWIDHFQDPEPIAYEFVTGPIATLTMRRQLEIFGGPEEAAQFEALFDLVGIDCRNLDSYAYGSVQVNASAGEAAITLKDANGAPLRDENNPDRVCARTF